MGVPYDRSQAQLFTLQSSPDTFLTDPLGKWKDLLSCHVFTLIKGNVAVYSGTSDKEPSEIGTTSLQGTKLLPPKCPLFGGSTVYNNRLHSLLLWLYLALINIPYLDSSLLYFLLGVFPQGWSQSMRHGRGSLRSHLVSLRYHSCWSTALMSGAYTVGSSRPRSPTMTSGRDTFSNSAYCNKLVTVLTAVLYERETAGFIRTMPWKKI